MALRKPPALKAILAAAATEELFKEDVHYMDGVFHVDEFELTMDLDQGRTGAPDFSLEESAIAPAHGLAALVAQLHEASARRRLLALAAAAAYRGAWGSRPS